MKKIVALPAPKPRSDTYKKLAWAYMGIIVVMAIGQLFSFEDFLPLMNDYLLPGGKGTASLVGGSIVAMEVLCVPYLLRMLLSPLMRWVGVVFSIAVPALWTIISVYALTTGAHLKNGGILGTEVSVPLVLQLVVSLALLVLSVAVAYGLRVTESKTAR